MMDYKEMSIRKAPTSTMPQLPLNGKWLEELGFIAGTFVTAVYKDSCLTIKTDGLERLEERIFTFCVTSKLVRQKPRTQLVLNGLLLKKYGFSIGDRVALALTPNMIQITKINRFMVAEAS